MIFDSGSAWLNADQAASMISFPDLSMTPLVVGGVGYFRCLFFFFCKLLTFSAFSVRVNYDKNWWQEIAEVLRTDTQRIDPMNRAQVLLKIDQSNHECACR